MTSPVSVFDGAAGRYVPVFVPEERLPEVHRLLANAPTSAPVSRAESAPSQPSASEGDDWSGTADARFTDLGFVQEHLAPRSETVREAARFLARHAGEWTTSEEIAEELQLPHGWNSLAGAFGAAGRYFANRGINLPWDWTYDTPDRRIRLKMDPEIAQVVLEAL